MTTRATLAVALCLSFATVTETPHAIAAATVQACSLITRADVQKATGADPYVDPESAGGGICNFGTGELKLYAGPDSWHAWEATMKAFKKDKEPRTPATGFGERAYFFDPTPDNAYQGNVAFLVVQSGNTR